MEHDGWSFAGLSAASLRSTYHHHQSTLKSHSDFYIEFEDFDGDDEDLRLDFPCPFCSEDFDLVGLCCHLDEEHPSEAKSGHNLKPHKGECLALSFSRKELQDEHFRSIFGGSPSPVSTSKMALDPLLSFLHKAPTSEKSDDLQSISSAEVVLEEKTSEEASLEGNSRPPPLSDKDQEEKAERCKFVQGLLWSTFLDDGL
ncbi:hypothetical protein L484_007471 [Morus notabilis]|uniref:Uncharacterized protein n=1 Tax=Morus notabilis TaxID=981085 RepID=W9SA28_9ROSA|nr:hypothetical protein L484_007471 [Morus notabilis]